VGGGCRAETGHCVGRKRMIFIYFKCTKKQKLRGIQNVLNSEWLNVNVDIADKQSMRT
jgi:hypothetical protein